MKWARDLETTSAKQAQGVLNNGSRGFCCLGRLCVIAGSRGERCGTEIAYGGETTVLPTEVMDKVGMETDTGEYSHNHDHLAGLNDDGVSFVEIAKIIRKHWKSL